MPTEPLLRSEVFSGLLGIVLTIFVGFDDPPGFSARKREEWLQSGQVGLSYAMRGDQVTEELGDNILSYLTRYAGAVAGAFFVEEEGQLSEVGLDYGVPPDAKIPEAFDLREGLLGQAAADGKPVLIENVPDGYLAFGSLSARTSREISIISPATIDGSVNTVIELASSARSTKAHQAPGTGRHPRSRWRYGQPTIVSSFRDCWKIPSASRKSCKSREKSCGFRMRSSKSKAGP